MPIVQAELERRPPLQLPFTTIALNDVWRGPSVNPPRQIPYLDPAHFLRSPWLLVQGSEAHRIWPPPTTPVLLGYVCSPRKFILSGRGAQSAERYLPLYHIPNLYSPSRL